MANALLLVASFPLILGGAVLFTNSVEWLGHELRLAQGAVGSILAAVGTALPESVIPVVAVIGGEHESSDVAIGAIVGAPFLLATLALALVGGSAYAFRRRRERGIEIGADVPTLRRDLAVFLAFFVVALALGFGPPAPVRYAAAVAFLLAYAAYALRTVRASGPAGSVEDLAPLYADWTRGDPPTRLQIGAQLVLGLAGIVGGSDLFVSEVVHVATGLGMAPLALSLLLAPFATELPEKANSFLWMRQGKDTLALGNLSGALVFQAALPVAIGLAFTDWRLGTPTLLAGGLALGGAVLAEAEIVRRRRAGLAAIIGWTALYAVLVVYVALAR